MATQCAGTCGLCALRDPSARCARPATRRPALAEGELQGIFSRALNGDVTARAEFGARLLHADPLVSSAVDAPCTPHHRSRCADALMPRWLLAGP